MNLFEQHNSTAPDMGGNNQPKKRVPCSDCQKNLGACKCWKRCSCTWLYKESKGCTNPNCSDNKVYRKEEM